MLVYGLTLNRDVFELSWSISELLKNKEGWAPGIIFFEKITSFACVVESGLNDIFQLKAQSHIFTKSLFSLEVENWRYLILRTEKYQLQIVQH